MNLGDLDILDNVSVPVFVLDAKNPENITYIFWNRVCVDVTSLPKSSVIGKTAIEVYPGRPGINAYDQHKRVALTGKNHAYNISLPYTNGLHFVTTRLKPVLDENGRVVRIIGTSIDRTAEKESQQALIRTEAGVTGLASEMEQFMSMAAHDLRTPMLHVQNISKMLRDNFQDQGDGKLQLIGMLEEVALKGTKLVSEILSYARATATTPQANEFELGQVCSDIFTLLDPKNQHRLSCAPASLHADDVALQIVLRNLVDNALKHGGGGSVDVAISVEPKVPDKLAFSVRDNGPGFDDPEAAFLGTGKFFHESGFGLPGIKRIINALGCEISAESVPRQSGALVRFTFPGALLN